MRPSNMVVKKDGIQGGDWAHDSSCFCGPGSRDWKGSGFSYKLQEPSSSWLTSSSKSPSPKGSTISQNSTIQRLYRGSSIQNWIYDIFHVQISTASKQLTKILKIICLVIDFRWDSVNESHPYCRAFEITQTISTWQPTNHLTWSCFR